MDDSKQAIGFSNWLYDNGWKERNAYGWLKITDTTLGQSRVTKSCEDLYEDFHTHQLMLAIAGIIEKEYSFVIGLYKDWAHNEIAVRIEAMVYATSKFSHYYDCKERMGDKISAKLFFGQVVKSFFLSKAARETKLQKLNNG